MPLPLDYGPPPEPWWRRTKPYSKRTEWALTLLMVAGAAAVLLCPVVEYRVEHGRWRPLPSAPQSLDEGPLPDPDVTPGRDLAGP